MSGEGAPSYMAKIHVQWSRNGGKLVEGFTPEGRLTKGS